MKKSILCLFFFAVNIAFSQGTILLKDAEYQILKDKARANLYVDIDSSIYYANKIEKSINNVHIVFAKGIKGHIYQLKNDSVASNKNFKEAYFYFNKIKSSKEKTKLYAYLLNFEGLSEMSKSNLKLALLKFQEGKKKSEEVGDIGQIIKFNSNIAIINENIGNYKAAISILKHSLDFFINNDNIFSDDENSLMISNTSLLISHQYEMLYKYNSKNKSFLDSAILYSKKSVIYAPERSSVKINGLANLGNIYFTNNNLIEAEKIYQSVLVNSKEKNMAIEYATACYNIGHLYYEKNENKKALLFFKKVDSIFVIKKAILDKYAFLMSNYYQAKIYKSEKNKEKALLHSNIYLENYESYQTKRVNTTIDVNNELTDDVVKKEMVGINNQYKNVVLINNLIIAAVILLIVLLIFFIIRNKFQNKLVKEKNRKFVENYESYLIKNNEDKIIEDKIIEDKIIEVSETSLNEMKVIKKPSISINIDEQKVNEIIELLKILEDKQTFLNKDFTQQYVAKKIKSNTTYLSYVVNKKFDKTFSEYANDLKINYVINKMTNDSTYRMYTTKAIAESVGFKNADSFASSFKKKTGITPYQFINEINNKKNLS